MRANSKYTFPCTATDIVIDYSRRRVILTGSILGLCQNAGKETDAEQ